MLGGKLITPGRQPDRQHVMTLIDESTEFMPDNYCFQTDFVGWTKTSPFVGGLKSCNQVRHVDVPWLADIDWSRHVGLVFDAPDDRRIVRTCISGSAYPRPSMTAIRAGHLLAVLRLGRLVALGGMRSLEARKAGFQ